ncbi:MAG TPA: sigma 54-interacting transcriptional regulator [Planctomycetota bacterium]|nr:sigma 54-interacting transcriptional regulator [Planctomycetota bacterium]
MSDPSTFDALRKRIAELEHALDRQARIQEALRGTRFSPGVSFFDLFCLELARASGADVVWIGTLSPGQRTVQTVGLSVDGAIAPGFEYSLDGTPCEDALRQDGASVPRGLAAHYPRDPRFPGMGLEGYCGVPLVDSHRRAIGVIGLLTRRPLPDLPGAEALLRVAAARASAELERSLAEARLRSVFDSNVVGIVFWNSAGDVTDANDAFLQMVRFSRDDLDAGRVRWKDLTPPEYEQRDAEALADVARTGVCAPYEKEYVRKDGSRIPVLIGGSRVTEIPLAGVAFVVDLGPRRTAEKAAREADELNRQVLGSMREGICVHDRELRYLHFNPIMERITGLPARDVLGKHPLELFPILKEMGIFADLERALLGETRMSPDLPYHAKGSGETRWTRTESLPLRDSSGAVVGVIAVIHDITELKGTEDALRDSERRLSEALRRTQERVVQLEEQVQSRVSFARLVGKSEAMQDVYRRLRLAAESDVTVLLTGESGTGKELAAAAVHSQSPRRSRPFVAVNCSAIPEGILESELFGHVKGAFTGASRDKTGLFQAAEGGTLFLDEVGDMSPVLQVKVLRALQEREIRRVGDELAIKVNVRLVTATNRDLTKLIEQGLLREDFYYRIRVFEIQLPPLRERKEDLALLVDHLIEELSRSTGRPVRGMEPAALKALLDYSWPGNVRELRNAMEHAFVTVKGELLRQSDLPFEIRAATPAPAVPVSRSGDPEERSRILEALHRTAGKRTDAARRLGISRVTLWHRMRTLGIDPAEGLDRRTSGGARRP